jgi:hypothetical protein
MNRQGNATETSLEGGDTHPVGGNLQDAEGKRVRRMAVWKRLHANGPRVILTHVHWCSTFTTIVPLASLRARRMEEFGGGDGLADVALGVVGDVNEETTEGGGQGSLAD